MNPLLDYHREEYKGNLFKHIRISGRRNYLNASISDEEGFRVSEVEEAKYWVMIGHKSKIFSKFLSYREIRVNDKFRDWIIQYDKGNLED